MERNKVMRACKIGIRAMVLMGGIAGLLTGCESDGSYAGGDIVGRWAFKEARIKLSGTPWEAARTVTREDAAARGMFASIRFVADGTCRGEWISADGGDRYAGTWATDGNVLTVKTEKRTVTGEYDVSGDTMHLLGSHTHNGVKYDAKITLMRQ